MAREPSQTSRLFVSEVPDQHDQEIQLEKEERPELIVLDNDSNDGHMPTPPRSNHNGRTAARRPFRALESNEIIELSDDDDDNPSFVKVRIPGKSIVRIREDELLAFVKTKCTRIFRNAYNRCLSDQLERTLTYHPDTLARGTAPWIIKCYKEDWKRDLKKARAGLQKELELAEKIKNMHRWEDEAEKYDREFVEVKRNRLAVAKEGETAFRYLVELLEEKLLNR